MNGGKPMTKIKYNALNIRLLKTRFDLTNIDLGKIIRKSINTVTVKVNGKVPLTAKEIELLCNELNILPNSFFDVISS